jgi:hypothetical protein
MAICTMTIHDNTTGEVYESFGVGQFWDLIAEDFEQKNPNKKVVKTEGIRSISKNELILDSQKKKEIISQAMDLFVLDEWQRSRDNRSTIDTQERIQLAIYMIEEMTTKITRRECNNAIHISS